MTLVKKTVLKLTTLVLLLAVAFGMLAGCDGGGGGGDQTLRIMMLTNAGSELYYSNLFNELEDEMGITIDYAGYAFQDYNQKLLLELQNDPPDIFYVRPDQIKSLVEDDMLADLTEYIEENVDTSVLVDTFNTPFRYDGTNVGAETGSVYAVNGGFSYQGLAYNKAIIDRLRDRFRTSGLKAPDELDEDETYTWDEFTRVLNIVHGASAGGASGTSPVIGMNIPAGDMLLQAMMNFGSDILVDGTVYVDSESNRECFNWLLDRKKEGVVSLNASYPEWSGQTLVFYTTSGSWEMAPYGETDASSGVDANANFMPWPTKTGKYEDTRALIDGAGYGVYKYSDNLELAMEVATYFMRAEVLDDLCKRGYGLPMTKSLADGEYLNDANYHPDYKAKKFLTDVVSGVIGEISPLDNGFSREWYDITLCADIDSIWNGSTTVDAYLSEKQPEVQARYDFYNKVN